MFTWDMALHGVDGARNDANLETGDVPACRGEHRIRFDEAPGPECVARRGYVGCVERQKHRQRERFKHDCLLSVPMCLIG